LLGETLQNAGYNTIGFGKWHNGRESFQRSFSDGDEIMFGGMADHWNVPVYHYDPSGEYSSRLPILDYFGKYVYAAETRWREADHINSGKHSTDMIADSAIEMLNKYSGSKKPFYMYLSFLAPHDPRRMPQKYLDMYADIDIPLPENFMGGHPFNNGELAVRDELLAVFPRDPDEIRRHLKEYYAMITHVDDQIGRVIETLKQSGEYDNTIIIYSADNGLAVGCHGLMGKQNCYEHSLRVPLIFSGPGIPRNQKTDAYVYLLDIFPTICDMLGIDTPNSVDGESFAGIFNGEKINRQNLYFAYRDCIRAMKNRQYKLIEYVVDSKHNMTQLFDLENDPEELNNLASDHDYTSEIEELRKEMRAWCEKWDETDNELGKNFWDVFGKCMNEI
jgi:arylsulfatase A-like enzyme